MKSLKMQYLWVLCIGFVVVMLSGCGSKSEEQAGAASPAANGATSAAERGPISAGGGRSIDPRTAQNGASPPAP